MKPYHAIPIQDCGEPLVPIPSEGFILEFPPPYERLGANYEGRSPYCLRRGVLTALMAARTALQHRRPGWKIRIFDAYRPLEVQQFMVDYTFQSVIQERDLSVEDLAPEEQQAIWEQVYQIWAIPSSDPRTPPPHSTGAALDITLVDAGGNSVDMGGEIDELSPRSQPNYYARSSQGRERDYHARRQLLNDIMSEAGFYRHPGEWWHFSLGDQMWAWQFNQDHPDRPVVARYGRCARTLSRLTPG